MKTDCKIYLATPMTGINCDQLWIKSIHDRQVYEREGLTVISPIDGEGIPFAPVKLQDRSEKEMFRV